MTPSCVTELIEISFLISSSPFFDWGKQRTNVEPEFRHLGEEVRQRRWWGHGKVRFRTPSAIPVAFRLLES
jgi:hypothetical protein